jgi:uncharacterized protein
VTSEPCIGLLLAELHFPQYHSLKEKRRPLVSLRDSVRRRYHAGFSEVGLHDSWQRAEVLVVVAASSLTQASEQVDDIDRFLHAQEFEVARTTIKSAYPVHALWPDDC